ncbi:MAG: preprotein translocase subunit YajC [Verrucomicrobiae bacterium]|nr:preprotein translocase subunit YajC [Verrucomicrobiae bacterium]MCP5522077.1 preprotein translocase subunit YajC [Verrucomicrobiales bacterium]
MVNCPTILMLGAQAATSQPDPRAQTMQLVLMMGTLMIMFYFVFWRPQQKKQKQHTEMLATLKPGDKVVTSSGICGVIISMKDRTVTLRSTDSKLEVLKGSISDIMTRSGGSDDKS